MLKPMICTLVLGGAAALLVYGLIAVRSAYEPALAEHVVLGDVTVDQDRLQALALIHQTLVGATQDGQQASRVWEIKTPILSMLTRISEADCLRVDQLTSSDDQLIAFDEGANQLHVVEVGLAVDQPTALQISTRLQECSGLAFFALGERRVLVVADTPRNYLLDFDQLVQTKDFRRSLIATYPNRPGGQGIVHLEGFLVEARSTLLGRSTLEVVRVDDVIAGAPVRRLRILPPIHNIQDLAWSEGHLYVADQANKLHRLKVDLDYLREQLPSTLPNESTK